MPWVIPDQFCWLALNLYSTCAVKRRWSTAGESAARELGSLHPEAIGAARRAEWVFLWCFTRPADGAGKVLHDDEFERHERLICRTARQCRGTFAQLESATESAESARPAVPSLILLYPCECRHRVISSHPVNWRCSVFLDSLVHACRLFRNAKENGSFKQPHARIAELREREWSR